MAVYTHLSQDTLAQLAGRFGLSPLESAKGIAEGVENSNFLLQAPDRKAILTVFEKRVSADELPFFMTLMQHLAAKGVPCPTPLLHDAGEVLLQVQGKPACAVSFLEGQSIEPPSAAHCEQLGAAMARLHLAGRDAPMSRSNDLWLAGWQALYAKTKHRLDEIESGLERLVSTELEAIASAPEMTLPRGIIHADLFPNNVFFDATETLSGIIDFYFACDGFFAYDIAICLNCWCFDAAQHNAEKEQALLRGYESVRPLEKAEREQLNALARMAALRFLLTRAHDWLFQEEGAIVTPHDPLEYARKLEHWSAT